MICPPKHSCTKRVAATVLVEELRALGSFSPATVDLLDTAREELGRFLGLTADGASTFEDFAYDFFLDRGKALTAAIRLEAEDDAALGRMIRRWLRNWLIDLNSQTALGALRDRLEKRMSRDGRFGRAPVGHYWRLNDGPAEAGAVDVAALASVARRVHVTFFRNPQTAAAARNWEGLASLIPCSSSSSTPRRVACISPHSCMLSPTVSRTSWTRSPSQRRTRQSN